VLYAADRLRVGFIRKPRCGVIQGKETRPTDCD